jgi:hypothetical protein
MMLAFMTPPAAAAEPDDDDPEWTPPPKKRGDLITPWRVGFVLFLVILGLGAALPKGPPAPPKEQTPIDKCVVQRAMGLQRYEGMGVWSSIGKAREDCEKMARTLQWLHDGAPNY